MREKEMIARKREIKGKGKLREYRTKGIIPGIVYGKDEENKMIFVETKEIRKIYRSDSGAHSIIDLKIDDNDPIKVVIKDTQHNPLDFSIIHIDFQHVDMSKPITIYIPITLEGVSEGVKAGGILDIGLREIEIKCLPANVPDKIEVNIEHLKIGDALHVKDISIPGVEILEAPESVIAHVLPPIISKEPTETEGEEEEETTES